MQQAWSPLSRIRPGLLGMILLAAACTQEEAEEPYAVATVTRRDIVVSASAAGVVEPIMTVEVKSKASGEIVEVAVEEGALPATPPGGAATPPKAAEPDVPDDIPF